MPALAEGRDARSPGVALRHRRARPAPRRTPRPAPAVAGLAGGRAAGHDPAGGRGGRRLPRPPGDEPAVAARDDAAGPARGAERAGREVPEVGGRPDLRRQRRRPRRRPPRGRGDGRLLRHGPDLRRDVLRARLRGPPAGASARPSWRATATGSSRPWATRWPTPSRRPARRPRCASGRGPTRGSPTACGPRRRTTSRAERRRARLAGGDPGGVRRPGLTSASTARKRDFGATPEPAPAEAARRPTAPPRFVVQRHDARALHYDLRLEVDGALASWAVPEGAAPARGRQAAGGAHRGPPARVPRLRRGDPRGPVRRGAHDGLGPRHLRRGAAGPTTSGSSCSTAGSCAGNYHLVRTGRRGGKDEWLVFRSGSGPARARGPGAARSASLRPMLASSADDGPDRRRLGRRAQVGRLPGAGARDLRGHRAALAHRPRPDAAPTRSSATCAGACSARRRCSTARWW